MRGRRRSAALRALVEIETLGCVAAGYRLAGENLDRICCRHLYASDRLLTAWLEQDQAVVVVVGPHDRSAVDVYDKLLAALNLSVPADEREKPSCCDDEGLPPADDLAANFIVDAVERASRKRR